MYKIKLTRINVYLSAVVITLIFSYFLFGFLGMKTIGGIILLFMFPMYLIFDSFEFNEGEKIIFSFFIGVGIYSSIVYYTSAFLTSFKTAMVVAFVLLTILGIFLQNKKTKKK